MLTETCVVLNNLSQISDKLHALAEAFLATGNTSIDIKLKFLAQGILNEVGTLKKIAEDDFKERTKFCQHSLENVLNAALAGIEWAAGTANSTNKTNLSKCVLCGDFSCELRTCSKD